MAGGGARQGAGRKRVPIQLRVITGRPDKRPKAQQGKEPMPRRARLHCPHWTTDRVKPYWERFAEYVHELGVGTVVDAPALEQLVEAYADWRDAVDEKEKVKEENSGRLSYEATNPQGDSVFRVHPIATHVNECDRRLRTLLELFGMTPSSRMRLQVPDDGSEKDDKAKAYGL